MSDNDNNSNGDSDIRVRKRSSLVWQYFEKLSSTLVKCRVCQHEQKYLGNTANALRHLKVKHDVDARPIGLTDPENVKRMKALTNIHGALVQTIDDVDVKNESTLDYQLYDEEVVDGDRRAEQRKMSLNRPTQLPHHEEETEIDPYADAEDLVDYVGTNDSYQQDNKNMTSFSIKADGSAAASGKKRNMNLVDERLIAETEYFREKAAYYRIQKHLSALQAKRVKYELDQLFAKNSLAD